MNGAARNTVSLVSGLVFALGLGLSGMTKPAKVEGFLDVTGAFGGWDPSLMFVMVGAISVYAAAAWVAKRRTVPLFSPSFAWPTRHDIDLRLLAGAALFGVGWGLSGYCPGPALVSVVTLTKESLVFVAVLLVTLHVTRRLLAARAQSAAARVQLAE